jgi:serine/threonine protein kinase
VQEQIAIESLNSPHVIRKYETIRTEHNFYSVMEFANGKTLQDLINFRGRLSEAETWVIIK